MAALIQRSNVVCRTLANGHRFVCYMSKGKSVRVFSNRTWDYAFWITISLKHLAQMIAMQLQIKSFSKPDAIIHKARRLLIGMICIEPVSQKMGRMGSLKRLMIRLDFEPSIKQKRHWMQMISLLIQVVLALITPLVIISLITELFGTH